jgi:membrane protein DedA with SNARE-associated domain
VLTALGSLIWCFAFAGAGYAAGGTWQSLHHAFRYLDYGVLAGILVLAALLLRRVGAARRSA